MRPEETRQSRRADDDRRRDSAAEQLDRLIALRRAGQDLRHKLDVRQRLFIAAHRDLVACRAVDHVEQHARKTSLGERAQRRNAIGLALEGRRVHHTLSRYALTALSRNSLRLSAGENPAVAQSRVASHWRQLPASSET